MKILELLPATYNEIAAITGKSKHVVNAGLQRLKRMGLVKMSDKFIRDPESSRGKPSAIWVRCSKITIR